MKAKVRTCLWFEKDAVAAAKFYVSLLPDSRIEKPASFEHMLTGEADGVTIVEFTLAGAPYQIMQAGPHQQFNDMMSIVVMTDSQAETDRLWEALTANGGMPVQCGWLKDRWGVAWQIVPRRVSELIATGEKPRVHRMLQAMMPMQKLEIAALEAAYAQ
ncbi:MAG: VOC family protein [Alphaproteobacteria bacterium]|nr:MAG: VOC family protein [Alphaproteobacteria bacterium]